MEVEWRAVSDQQSSKNVSDEKFCSITSEILDNDILQQQLGNVVRQREELLKIETDLRAQLIARSEILGLQNRYDIQIKEYSNTAVKLQEQLRERDQKISELDRKMGEKDKELHAIKLANEAAWAKEDLLQEQIIELATYRRERDNSESERGQHLKQIQDLEGHIQEKESQILDFQEQNKVAQETIIFKDQQLREAHTWISRVQEMGHSLQAELRERTEQYNQLWLVCQRHFAEMDAHFSHKVQQLQFELADAREKSGVDTDDPRSSQTDSNDGPQFTQNNGSQLDVVAGDTSNESSGVPPNGNVDNIPSNASADNVSTQATHVPGIQIVPSSIHGMRTFLPLGQVAVHPFVIHQQAAPHSVPSHVSHSHATHFHSIPSISSAQHCHIQQGVSDASEDSIHNRSLHPEQNPLQSDANHIYGMSLNGQSLPPEYLNVHINQVEHAAVIISVPEEAQQVSESTDRNMQQILQLQDTPRLDCHEDTIETKDNDILTNQGPKSTEQLSFTVNTSFDAPSHLVNLSDPTINNSIDSALPEPFVSVGEINTVKVEKAPETALLDERSLLASIVRTIPPGVGGRICISTTLPNRLGKVLAPLHWHDYKWKYGKLDDFVAGHSELFLTEGDYIQLREGAQEIIAATSAVAKVAAAAAAASADSASYNYSSLLPSVALTPMAQSHRTKKVSSINSNPLKTDKSGENGTNVDRFVSSNSQNKVISTNGRPQNLSGKQQGRTTGLAGNFRR